MATDFEARSIGYGLCQQGGYSNMGADMGAAAIIVTGIMIVVKSDGR